MSTTTHQGAEGAETRTAGPMMVLLPMDDPRRPLHHSGLPSAMIRAGGDAFHRLKRDHSLVADSCSLAVGIYRAMTEAHAKEIATLTPPAALASPRADSDERTAGAAAWVAKRLEAARRDSKAHPEGHSNRTFYEAQAIAYENVLSLLEHVKAATPAPRTDGGMTAGEEHAWTFERTRTYLLAELERLRADLHTIGEDLTGEQGKAASWLDVATGRVANVSSVLASATPAQPAGAVPDSLRALSEAFAEAACCASCATPLDCYQGKPCSLEPAGSKSALVDHEFKSHPDVFWPAARGEKTFEYRRDDRGGYEIGQTVRLRCYDPTCGYHDAAPLDRRITNILRGGEFELPQGYCILSLAPLAPHPAGQSEDDTPRCGICDKPLIAGQRVMQDVELGTVHAACCGPEREAYVKDIETGEPLGPNDPIPQGYVYEPEQADGQAVRTILARLWCQAEGNDPDDTISDAGHTVLDGTLGGLDKKAFVAIVEAERAILKATTPPGGSRYQYREIGEGEGWRDCSRESYLAFASDPHIDTREIKAHPAGQSAGSGAETDALVDRFSAALKVKLRAAEAKYGWKNGWLKSDWQVECQNGLLRHVGKGDPLDVAAYAAFCWHHGWPSASRRSTDFVTGAVIPTAGAIAAYETRYPEGSLSETSDNAIEAWNRVAAAVCLAEKPAPDSTRTGQGEDWRDDPSSDVRWNAGLVYGQDQLCRVLGVDPDKVSWDAATETLDGDVQSVICNILRAWAGDDWQALAARPAAPEAQGADDLAERLRREIGEIRTMAADPENKAAFCELTVVADNLEALLPAPPSSGQGGR
ncbi:DUF3850 domain-containing protein [Methylorubrum thiocyanatum]|uniref:DUF3850 domain-containing protein n=1 Tax=Methylorubrum thiocyanatum TaxID=47958 RepID=UPI0035C79E39